MVGGSSATKVIRTIDLMLLKPYFHGTTSRIGAPFWLGRSCPYSPVARRVSGCMASSMRSPSRYGQPILGLQRRSGIWSGSHSVSKATYLASPAGSARRITSASGKPRQGTTIDHPSTHRKRYTRSSTAEGETKSSSWYSAGLAHSPSTLIVQGDVTSPWARRAGSSLSSPNS